MFIFWKCIQCTIHWDKTQMLKNGKKTAKKMKSWTKKFENSVISAWVEAHVSWSLRTLVFLNSNF